MTAVGPAPRINSRSNFIEIPEFCQVKQAMYGIVSVAKYVVKSFV
jgi:hypothetical protein